VHLRVAWRTLVLASTPDTDILPILADLLAAETGGDAGFVTACDLTVDPDLFVTVRVAGHPAPLVCAHGKTTYLDVEVGPPLGVQSLGSRRTGWVSTGGWPQSRASLDAGSSLILYTDGLLDAYAVPGNARSLGIEEFVGAVDGCAADGGAVSSWIRSLVDGAPQQSVDDMAVVVMTTRPAVDR
jgi:hypothetical protein